MKNLEKGFEGYSVPEKIRRASENIVRRFNIRGICDPMYISNVIAHASGSGDGCGNFTSDIIANIQKIAKSLQFAYGCNIRKDEIDELVAILEG